MTVNNWINIIQDRLFPPTCILCGNAGIDNLDICACCRRRLPLNTYCCALCGESFSAPVAELTLCGRCLQEKPVFDKTFAPFTYNDEISYLNSQLKFGAQFKIARLLGSLLAEELKSIEQLPNCIIPMPLHSARYHERGFNQALEIGKCVASCLRIEINHRACVRRKDTPHQTGLSAKQRRQNIRNAFAMINPVAASHVAILDDVMTTGATANELAKVLKKAGVKRVDVWVCARA